MTAVAWRVSASWRQVMKAAVAMTEQWREAFVVTVAGGSGGYSAAAYAYGTRAAPSACAVVSPATWSRDSPACGFVDFAPRHSLLVQDALRAPRVRASGLQQRAFCGRYSLPFCLLMRNGLS